MHDTRHLVRESPELLILGAYVEKIVRKPLFLSYSC